MTGDDSGSAGPPGELRPPVEYGLLGPMTMRRGAAAVRVPAGQQRVLLAALLLRPGRPVTADELAALMWPESAPSSVRLSVQNAVMRLRRTLGEDAAELVTRPEGYLLRAGPGQLDVTRFEAAVAAGQAAARAGRWAEAARQLRTGLGLWRGEPLSGVPSDALAARERPRLAELRMQALEARIDADLHLGRHSEVITELRQLAADEPLRERLPGLLMLALYRDGQQGAALAAYQAARETLIAELGTEPGPELRALHQQLLAHDPALALRPVAGREPPEVRYSLPPATAAFTGRLGELDRITGAVAAAAPGAVVAIRAIGGMPGVGKTTLAVHAARLLRDRFPDRQLFVDLRGHTPGQDPVSPADALAGLLAATGVEPRFLPAGLAARTALWRDKMAGQQAVLVLDNAASSAQVAPLLPGADSCLVLITSRRHLADLPGTVVPVQVDVLPPGQAGQMLLLLAQREAATPDQQAAVAELAELCGYLPLAITLLARLLGRHPSWSLADLVTEARASLLGMAAEEDSVAAAFELSYRYLDGAQQQFFRALGLHPGTAADRYTAAALAGVPVADAERHLDRLHREGLLTETGYRRYGMHDLIRQYAADRAAADPPAHRDAAVDRLLDYYQGTAARAHELIRGRPVPGRAPAAPDPGRAEPGSGGHPPGMTEPAGPELRDGEEALAWGRAELPSMLACLDHAARTGARARVVALTAGLAEIMRRETQWPPIIARHAAAAEAARDLGDQRGRAAALAELALSCHNGGNHADAYAALAQAREVTAGLHDQAAEARLHQIAGSIQSTTGDLPGATASHQQALAAYRALGDRAGQAANLLELAELHLTCGDYPEADPELAESLELYTAVGDVAGQTIVLTSMAGARRLTGDYVEATRLLERVVPMNRERGDRTRLANSLQRLGQVRQEIGDFAGSVRAQEEALAFYREVGAMGGVANTLIGVGDSLRWCGDYAAAAAALEEGVSVARRASSRQAEANGLLYLGVVRRLTGDLTDAADCMENALAIYAQLGDRGGAAEALNETGAVRLAAGQPGQARACHDEALRLGREIGGSYDQAQAEAGLARCDLADGDLAAAAASLERARQIHESAGEVNARTEASLDEVSAAIALEGVRG